MLHFPRREFEREVVFYKKGVIITKNQSMRQYLVHVLHYNDFHLF